MSLEDMNKRLKYAGGNTDGRITAGKLKSFQSALWNSYQAEWITYKGNQYRCLINADKLTTDYGQMILSIEYESGIKPGSTFYWNRTEKHWIVFSSFDEEESYFRAKIRECDYNVDVDGEPYYIWMRGPVETAIIWRQKHQIEVNDLNYSLAFWITKDEKTINYFSRHQIVKFDGHNWKVAATDKYSQEGVIEVYLQEYFDNTMEEEMIIPEIEKPDQTQPHIAGPQEVNVYDEGLSYSIVDASGGEFVISSNKAKIVNADSTSCEINILTGKAATIELKYVRENEDDIVIPIMIKSF